MSSTRPQNHHHHLIGTLIFTFVLLGLIGLSLGNANSGIVVAAMVSVIVIATVLHFVLPSSAFFSAVFANSIGIYACVFVFFLDLNFGLTAHYIQAIAFVLPLVGFLTGVLWRREYIGKAVDAGETGPGRRHPLEGIIWVAPLVAIGVASFVLPLRDAGADEQEVALLLGMAIIALTALLAARDIAAFLLSTAILSEDFFANAALLARPAFSFFTVYSLLALIFGCLYTILDRYSQTPNFLVGGEPKELSLGDGLYLSIVTLSTVGYGDLSAHTALARVLVATEIFLGVLLLLFGLQAILTSRAK